MPHLISAFSESWRIWREDYRSQHLILNESARAIVVNQNFYWHAQQRLNDDPGVAFLEDNLQRYIVFDEAVIVRFKLLGEGLESHNYPTARARQWVQQVALPTLPKLGRLNFGYKLDITGSVIDGAFVTLPNGIAAAVNDWIWQVLGSPVDLTTFGIQLRLPSLLNQQAIVYDYEDYSEYMGKGT
jgi:hypothetical protein